MKKASLQEYFSLQKAILISNNYCALIKIEEILLTRPLFWILTLLVLFSNSNLYAQAKNYLWFYFKCCILVLTK
jgi:hypothetical protein